MATPLGILFSTDENAVAQANVQLLRKTVKSLVIEYDQRKFKELLSLGSANPRIMRQYRKVSSETHSRISSEISLKVARTSAHSTNGATSSEVLKTSCATHVVCVNVSQETRMTNVSVHDHSDGEDQSRHHSPL